MSYRTITIERVNNGYVYTCVHEDGAVDILVNTILKFPGIDELLDNMVGARDERTAVEPTAQVLTRPPKVLLREPPRPDGQKRPKLQEDDV